MASKATGAVTVEVDAADNSNWHFKPLGRKVRGRFEWLRCKNPLMAMVAAKYDRQDVPGQVLILDFEKQVGYLVDPLHEPEYSGLVEKFRASGLKLPAAREEFPLDEHGVKTWAYWLGRAVEAKQGRIVSGELPDPDSLPGKTKKLFYTTDEPDRRDRVIEKLVAIVAAGLPPAKRAELLAELQE